MVCPYATVGRSALKIKSIHARELPGAPEEVSPLLDGLDSPGDGLWPSDRWPTTPLELDGRSRSAPKSHRYQRLDPALYPRRCLGLAAGTAITLRQTDGSIKGGPS
jgi:hypothetical protein